MDVIKKTSGPCVILAGAGTGKTHKIVEKIKYLIESKTYNPEKIVCITFSNEAANNLYSRVKSNISTKKEPIVRTFHGFSSDLLKEHGHLIDIKKDFSIITPDEAKILIHKFFSVAPSYCHKYIETISTCKDLGISEEDFEKYLEKYLEEDIDKKINDLHFELQMLNSEANKLKSKEFTEKLKKFSTLRELKKFLSIWKAYEKIKTKHNYQDYSDLNNKALKLLSNHPEITDNFDYLIVDEFQDTNKIQLELIKKIAVKKNITVVGDLNQSIYRFRGAYRENIAVFKKYFNISDGDIFELNKSFRSPNKVLRVAHSLIINNYENKDECFEVSNAYGDNGDNVEVYELKNAREEARKVLEIIKEELSKGKKYEDICVMFRTHQQGRILKSILEMEDVPFSSVSNKSLLKQNKIKIAMDYLKILDLLKNKKKGGEEVWWDLIYHQNLESDDLIKIGKFIKDNKELECLSEKIFSELNKLNLSQHGKTTIKMLIEQIDFLLPATDKKIDEIVKQVYSVAGLNPDKNFEDAKQDFVDLNKFYELALNNVSLHYSELGSFVNYLEILENLGINIESSNVEEKGVRLMTSHATKGLEYPIVIITNFAQGRFPIERVTKNNLIPNEVHPEFSEVDEDYLKEFEKNHQLLEERRLAYVSFTRAKQKLILTYAKDYAGKKVYPSQFLNEIKYKENSDINFLIDDEEKFKDELTIKPASLSFNSKNFETSLSELCVNSKNSKPKLSSLSPSSLLLFKECQKKFEYKYIYNMPDKKPTSWEEIRLGSFVHHVLEKGVKANYKTEKEFVDLTKIMHREPNWESVDLDESILLVRIFFNRNKDKYSRDSRTEQQLKMEIEGIKFVGFADRIDFTNKGLEIIDYKTGKSQISMTHRNWQLGYYALAASKIGRVSKVTLEMLRQNKSLEFEIDERGIARGVNSRMEFDLNQIRDEIFETAKEIKKAYKEGFKLCPIEKNCEFCEEIIKK